MLHFMPAELRGTIILPSVTPLLQDLVVLPLTFYFESDPGGKCSSFLFLWKRNPLGTILEVFHVVGMDVFLLYMWEKQAGHSKMLFFNHSVIHFWWFFCIKRRSEDQAESHAFHGFLWARAYRGDVFYFYVLDTIFKFSDSFLLICYKKLVQYQMATVTFFSRSLRQNICWA